MSPGPTRHVTPCHPVSPRVTPCHPVSPRVTSMSPWHTTTVMSVAGRDTNPDNVTNRPDCVDSSDTVHVHAYSKCMYRLLVHVGYLYVYLYLVIGIFLCNRS